MGFDAANATGKAWLLCRWRFGQTSEETEQL